MSKSHPGPWRPCRWWENCDIEIDDIADDEEERQGLLKLPFLHIQDSAGQNVMSAHDLFEISDEETAFELASAPELRRLLFEVYNIFLERHGCFPIDNKKWNKVMSEAHDLLQMLNLCNGLTTK